MLGVNNVFEAYSLNDFYTAIDILSKENGKNKLPIGTPIWYRGVSNSQHDLIPSLFRTSENNLNQDGTTCDYNLRESYRYQNFKSRVYHNVNTNPSNTIEWQALYQHFGGKTRLLDWSESAYTALTFALEPFIDPLDRKDLDYKRCHINPCVWILMPTKLNEMVYDYYANNLTSFSNIFLDIIEKADCDSFADNIKKVLSLDSNKSLYFSSNNGKNIDKYTDICNDKIFSLCVLDDIRKKNFHRLKNLIVSGEYNPFFYLLLRTYADAFPIKSFDVKNLLPPLAILHPYQSERIRAQRGAFTVFPIYNDVNGQIKFLKHHKHDLRAMNNNNNLSSCLYCVKLMDAEKIAQEILITGARQTELYPDNEYFVHTIEANNFHL